MALLKNNSTFAGYKVIRQLNTRHNDEREVYLTDCQVASGECTDNKTGHAGILTVFNLKAKRYDVDGTSRKRVPDFIGEVDFLRSRKPGDCFPRVIDCGITRAGGKRLGWMLQPKIAANSLTTEIKLQQGLCMADALKVMDALFRAVGDIARYTHGGGHYNITTDNILLDYADDNLRNIYLIGLSDMGASCCGSTPFSGDGADKRFRAPESAKGVFNHLSDIYSLGIVMSMMITGNLGLEHNGDGTENQLMKQFGAMLTAAPRIIIEKATNVNPSNRFQSVERFKSFVRRLQNLRVPTRTHVERPAVMTAGPNEVALPGEEEISFDKAGSEAGRKGKTQDATKEGARKGLDEVAGMSDLKNLFRRDFIRIVRNPKVARAYGIRPSNCTLLYGPQGCGKTFIAEKAAQESGLKYKVVNPSELGSIYIHGSQQKIAELFAEAEKKGPMILIFDEFDAIVPKRDEDLNENQANEVNEMLTQLNNCASRGIYVLATTNRPSLIDPAIMRKGRVDRAVYVSLPDEEARKELFRLEMQKRPCADIDYQALAAATDKYTCSDITFIVEESARLCFEETLDSGLSELLPISMRRLMEVIKATRPSVSETQQKEYQEIKAKMENRLPADGRKKVGFVSL